MLIVELLAPTLSLHYYPGVRYYRKLGKRLQQASQRVRQGMGDERFKKEVLDKLPLSLTDDVVLAIAADFGWVTDQFMGKVTKRKAHAMVVAQSGDVGNLLAQAKARPKARALAPPPAPPVGDDAAASSSSLPSLPLPLPMAPSPVPATPPPSRRSASPLVLQGPEPLPQPPLVPEEPLPQPPLVLQGPEPLPQPRLLLQGPEPLPQPSFAKSSSLVVFERPAPPPTQSMFDQLEEHDVDGEEASADAEIRQDFPAGGSDESTICVICMDVINEYQEEARLPCNHVLHRDCVDRWRAVAGVGEDQCPMHCERSVQQVAPSLPQHRDQDESEERSEAIEGQNEFL